MRIRLLVVGLLALFGAGSSAGATALAPRVSGWWAGTYTLHGPARIAFDIQGGSATVALGYGHADAQRVPVSTAGGRVRFALPGRPTPLVFDGRLRNGVRGTVRHGTARGSFRARRGPAPSLLARGLYNAGGREWAVVDDQFGPSRIDDVVTGEVHALYPTGASFEIGSGFATHQPVVGRARFTYLGGTILGEPATRIGARQLEVRFASAGAVLSGTLTLPTGAGRHPAVAFVHGSGKTDRAYLPDLTATLVHDGVAVLNYDKRGIGQSGGVYPGESAATDTLDILARDAQAAARFLAAQPEIDPSRVGLAGHSQGGWIMPLAASLEPAIRFLILFSGPTVTADESDFYEQLAGGGEQPQTLSDAEIDAEVLRHGPSGFDPMPFIRSLRIPAIWLFGGLDKQIPTRLSVQRLDPLLHDGTHDFEVAVFPNANHALVDTSTGLTSEMLRSDRFAPGLFARLAKWLRAHVTG